MYSYVFGPYPSDPPTTTTLHHTKFCGRWSSSMAFLPLADKICFLSGWLAEQCDSLGMQSTVSFQTTLTQIFSEIRLAFAGLPENCMERFFLVGRTDSEERRPAVGVCGVDRGAVLEHPRHQLVVLPVHGPVQHRRAACGEQLQLREEDPRGVVCTQIHRF